MRHIRDNLWARVATCGNNRIHRPDGRNMATTTTQGADVTVKVLDEHEGLAYFDARAHAVLGVSAATFLKAIDAHDVPADWDATGVCQLEMLLPFAR